MYYMYNPYFYYTPHYQTAYWPVRQYPNVDSKLLTESATETKGLMEEASIVLDNLANSKEFGTELMNAAQASDNKKVKHLIHSIEGVSSEINVNYTPDGLRLEFNSKVSQMDCCQLTVSLRWR